MDQWLEKYHRQCELNQTFTSEQLSDLLAAAGWELTGRKRKQDKVQAILHLEGYVVLPAIVDSLGLVQLEPA